jgi:hypothetical protein
MRDTSNVENDNSINRVEHQNTSGSSSSLIVQQENESEQGNIDGFEIWKPDETIEDINFHIIESKIVDVDTGLGVLVALDENGAIYTWSNDQIKEHGVLGRNLTENNRVPIIIHSPKEVKQIGAGYVHAFCITSDGQVYIWGISESLRGTEDGEKFRQPVFVSYSKPIVRAEVGRSLLGLTADGELYTYGGNRVGTIGDGTTDFCEQPYHVNLGERIIDISATGATSAALTESGKLFTWGFYEDGINPLINPKSPDFRKPYPLELDGIEGTIIDMEVSLGYGICLTDTNRVYLWGYPGMISWYKKEPVRGISFLELKAPENLIGVYTDYERVGVMNESGELFEWNFYQYEAEYRDRRNDLVLPRKLETSQRFKKIGSFYGYCLAIAMDDSVYGWGANAPGTINPELAPNWVLNPVEMNHFFSYSDLWIQELTKDPLEVVRSAINNQSLKGYTISVDVGFVEIDNDETQRIIEMYCGSELAETRGWSADYLQEHFVVVKANYFVEYDHTKTFMDDGSLEQYFYLTRDIVTELWSIIDTTSAVSVDS